MVDAADGAVGPDELPAEPGRRMLAGLDSPHPLAHMLPATFQDDDLALRFVSALDAVIAPIFATLDSVDAYFDADLTPADFLDWLAGWVGVALDDSWPLARKRVLVSEVVGLYGMRGTVSALRELLVFYAGGAPEIDDSGGVIWSPTPGADPPGRPAPHLRVRVRGADVDRSRIAALVQEHTPAHVPYDLEVTSE